MSLSEKGYEMIMRTCEFFGNIINDEGPISFYERVMEEVKSISPEIDENLVKEEINLFIMERQA